MAEYRRRRSTVKSLVDTFESGVSGSPRKGGKRVTPSKIITSPRNDNHKSVPSPKDLQGATEKGGRRLMSEDEVSSLVHSALLRARLATSSFSPRARSTRSPRSQSSTSPRGAGVAGHSPSYAKRPPSSSSLIKSTSGLHAPEDEDIPGPSSLSRRSQRTIYDTPKSRAGESSVYSFDEFQSPEQGEMDNVEVDINTFSTTFDEEGGTMTDEEDEPGPTIPSVNSSEAIIRRVEEEIANARKAAQEANRRLAGVSANLKDAKAAAMEGAAKLAVPAECSKDSAAKTTSGESRNPSPSVNPFSGEEDVNSTQAMFDSAMDVIGEEFEINGSTDDSKKLDCHNDHDEMSAAEDHDEMSAAEDHDEISAAEDPADPTMTRSREEEYLVTSAEELLDSLTVPADELVTVRNLDDQDFMEDEVLLSPSEEIDSLLRSSSNDVTDDVAVVARQRTIDITPIDTIPEGPSEETQTLRAKGKSEGSQAPHSNRETLDRKAQRDEAALLAIASIEDEDSIANEEIRASRDSAFDDNMADDDLLEWLPIGGLVDRNGETRKFRDNKVPVDELEAGKEAQAAPEAPGDDKHEETDGYSNGYADADENISEKEIVVPKELCKQEPMGEGKNEIQDHVDVVADKQAAVGANTTESPDDIDAAELGDENALSDAIDPATGDTAGSKFGSFAEKKPLESSEDSTSSHVVEKEDEGSEMTRGLPPLIVEAGSPTPKDNGDQIVPKISEQNMVAMDTNTDVIIYQVVSVGSTDATAVARHSLHMDPSFDGVDIAQSNLQPSLSTQEVIVDEAFEVVVEPFNFSADDQNELVDRMNASVSTSVSTESHFEESSAEESIEKREVCHQNDEEIAVEDSEEDNAKSKAPILIPDNVPDNSEDDRDLVQKAVIDTKIVEGDISVDSEGIQADLEETLDNNHAAEVVEESKEEGVHNKSDHNMPLDDDQVTQIMGNTEAERISDHNRDEKSKRPMTTISEENSEDTDSFTRSSLKVEERAGPPMVNSASTLSSQAQPNSVVPPVQSHAQVPQAPSPRQIALVENRRAAQAKEDLARNAMCGESGAPTGLPNPEKEIVHRVKRVKFKQRYPVPPQVKRPLRPAEIVFNNLTPAPKDKLHLSRPKKDLKELLEAAIGSSIQRRSNAFGALKVLSTQKLNKMTLVRTKGFLDSTVFAINENISSFEDTEAAIASRTRACSVILNVAEMKDNRYHILTHPGLANCLVKCIVEDKGEGRAIACSVFATIAKSPACREPMAKIHKLVDTLSIILKGEEPASFSSKEQNYIQEEKKDYSGDDEASRTVISNSYSSGSAASQSSIGSSHNSESRNRARLSACAALVHLSKECSVAQKMGTSTTLLHCVVATCNEAENPLHTKSLEILANMTRFPHNNGVMTTYPGLVDALIMNGNHKNDTDRLWSMRTLQNLSSDPSSKTILATGTVLELLSVNIMRQKYDEQLAAIAAVYNLSTEPGAVVPLTNTKNVVATLVHVAHNPTSSNDVRLMACDTLATLGLWLQTLAGAGTVPEGFDPVPLPTYITSGWRRWEK